MPFRFVPTGEIPDDEFDELAEHVFDTARNYEGHVDVAGTWPAVVTNFESPEQFSSALEFSRERFAIAMELDPVWHLLEILFPDDVFQGIVAPALGIVFYTPRTGPNWTLFSTEMNRFAVCVEIKTGCIKKLIDYLEGSVTEESPFFEHCCQQLLVDFITYATNRGVITDGRWYAVVEISDEPKHKDDTVHLPIRCKSIDSFSTDVNNLTPTVLLLYCAIRNNNSSVDELQRITNVRHLIHYNRMARDHGVYTPRSFVAILSEAKESLMDMRERRLSTFADDACGYLNSKSDWLHLKFAYNHKEPLKIVIMQERDYNSQVFRIGRDLFPEFYEQMKSIPAEADTVILKVYDEFEPQKHHRKLYNSGYESPEEFLLGELRERYIPEVVALKCIEYHNSANPGNKINAPRLFDCGQLEMVLDDSNNYIWRILARGCFLLEEYVKDCGDSAFTQLSVTAGLEQIKMLSQLGIRLLYIERSNTRVQSDGTIFLIDYSRVKLYDPQNLKECRCSFESMKRSFLWVMNDLNVEMPPAEVGVSFDSSVKDGVY
jgi:hypothetical protein